MWFLGNSRLPTGYWWPQVSFLENTVFPLSELDVCPRSDKSDPISSCPCFFLSGFCTGLSGLFPGGSAVISPQFQGKSGAQGKAGLNLLHCSFCAKAAPGFCVFLLRTRACWHHWPFPNLFSSPSHKQKGEGAPSIPIFCPAQVSP